jgi:hypothetical protein
LFRLQKIISSAAVALFLISCAPAADPALSTRAAQMAATGVAETLAAIPTNTMQPSTTFTLAPEPTQTTASTATGQSSTLASTLFAASGTLVNALPSPVSAAERADKQDNQTYVVLQNNTDQVIWFIIDSPIYLEYRFSDSFGILLGNRDYHYRAYIGSKGPIEGNFHIGNQDKHTITFTAGKVIFQGP